VLFRFFSKPFHVPFTSTSVAAVAVAAQEHGFTTEKQFNLYNASRRRSGVAAAPIHVATALHRLSARVTMRASAKKGGT
jgi:hypothetical protein